MDNDLAFQFSGPYIQTFMTAVQNHINKRVQIMTYFYNLTIQTADTDRLNFLGSLVGFPWPSAPAGTFDDNSFTFGLAADFPVVDNLTGFGTVSNPTIGGLLSSAVGLIGNLIPIGKYQQLLEIAAKIKHNGLTLKNIDDICFLFAPSYTINFNENGDILVVFLTVVGASTIWLVQTIFDRYTTEPLVLVSQG